MNLTSVYSPLPKVIIPFGRSKGLECPPCSGQKQTKTQNNKQTKTSTSLELAPSPCSNNPSALLSQITGTLSLVTLPKNQSHILLCSNLLGFRPGPLQRTLSGRLHFQTASGCGPQSCILEGAAVLGDGERLSKGWSVAEQGRLKHFL